MTAEIAMPSIGVAQAALCDIGHPEWMEYLLPHPIYGITIVDPCPGPEAIAKAVALAHQAAGHTVTYSAVPGHGHFDCEECRLS